MRITRVESQLLRVPLDRPLAAPAEATAAGLSHVIVLLARLDTDAGLTGLGFACALRCSGRGLLAVAEDDLGPLVLNEDPLDHERLRAKVYWRLQGVGRRGLVAQAYSALDLALWDLKGKVANLPLYKLLGGARTSAPAYGSDTAWLWMSPEEIIDASRPYLDQGLMGIKVKVGLDPEADADRLSRIREALGEDIWLGVDANQRYDYGTALAMGHFFEEEIGADWFEEPILCEDLEGHVRLATKLEVPIAAGETLFGLDEFHAYLERDALAVVQPDVTRLGGLTAWLKVAALAEVYHRPVSPHLLPEVGVHLACGLPGVVSVEYMPWLAPLWLNPPHFDQGRLVPPPHPGLGLEVNPEAVARYRVNF
jgi:L-alanine-DL-glutamate epimerase-like enolase superfamily enzyme